MIERVAPAAVSTVPATVPLPETWVVPAEVSNDAPELTTTLARLEVALTLATSNVPPVSSSSACEVTLLTETFTLEVTAMPLTSMTASSPGPGTASVLQLLATSRSRWSRRSSRPSTAAAGTSKRLEVGRFPGHLREMERPSEVAIVGMIIFEGFSAPVRSF